MVSKLAGKKLEIFVAASAKWHGRPLYSAIVERCREKEIAGATVVHCVEGYGSHHKLRTDRLFSLSDDLPVRIEIVELAERFDYVLDALKELLGQGLVVAHEVEIIHISKDAS
jgi:PII-like signaling protein